MDSTIIIMIVDKIYGLVIGEIVADIMSNISNINNQLGILSEIKQLSDAETFEIEQGLWTEPSALLLSYIQNIMASPGERKQSLERMATLHTNTCSGVFCGTLKDYHSALYATPVVFYYYTDFASVLQHLKDEGCSEITKLWTAIIDLAVHDVAKKTIVNPNSYGNLHLSDDSYEVFNIGEEGTLYELGEAETLGEQIRSVLHVFAYSRNFVEGLVQVVNYFNNPLQIACLYGQLAGAFYGLTDIPPEWIKALQKRKYINATINRLVRSPAISHVIKIEQKKEKEEKEESELNL